MAGAMLERILRYAAGTGSAKSQPPPMRILAGDNTDAMIAMSEAGVETVKGLAGEGPIFVDASHKLSPEEMEKIKKHLADGGNVWLHGFSSKNIANVASLFPFKPEMEPVDQKVHIAVRRSDDPLMSNLSSFDFCWTRMDLETRWNFFEASLPTAKLGTESLRIPSLEMGVALTEPRLLVKIPVGKGIILFDSLAWDKAIGAESERVARITASLSANLGANVRLVRDETAFDFFNVDFAPYANMGFHDKTADDGVGGWTDQGQNDMRFFLINHSGKGGGKDDGMEVEAENFPMLVNFLDRPFKIPDPKKNNGKSVISLRGEAHGVKLPSKIEGVKVGKKADRLWMLHSAGWSPPKPDMEVARYIVNYADGSKAPVPVRFNIEVSDWWNPKPLSNAKVAWTGRNLVQSPIGFYMMEWRNPSPGKEIASIDVVGDIAPTQFVCLGITGGVERGGAGGSGPVSLWNMSEISGGAVRNQVADGGVLKAGERAPIPAVVDNVPGLRFKDGTSLNADEKTCASLFSGSPFALRVKLCIDAPPPGYMGGIFQRMRYGESGFRLVVYQNLKVGAEIYVGGKQVNIASSVPLQPGKWYEIELRFDGKYAVLSLDGKISSMLETAPPAPCVSLITIGNASGKDYFLNGVVGSVELRNVTKEK
jgi:beta-galactosidase